MDVKTLSAMLGQVSAATTLDIYTHATSDMQYATARKIDCGIGKAVPQKNIPQLGQENAPVTVKKPSMTRVGVADKKLDSRGRQLNVHKRAGRNGAPRI